MRVGAKISRCSCWRSLPNLRVRPLGSSRLTVSSIGSIRVLRPTLGSRSSRNSVMQESGGRSMWLVCRIGS